MKIACFACLLLVEVALFGQSTSSFRPNRPHASRNLSRVAERPPFATAGHRTVPARPTTHPQSPGLNFAPAVTHSLPSGASSIAVADVNGDGKPDLIVASVGVGVMLGNGDGTFQPVVIYGSGGIGGSASVAVGDVNRDGKLDLVVANPCAEIGCASGSIGVLLGNGDGTFQTAATYSSVGYAADSVAVADLNGDGKADLVVTNDCDTVTDCGNGVSSGTVGVLIGNGDGTFQAAATYGTSAYHADSVAVADVNGDGKADLLVANLCGDYDLQDEVCRDNGIIGVMLGNGDGTFQAVAPYDAGGSYTASVAVADVNGDGKPDVVVGDGCMVDCEFETGVVAVLLGNGDGTFQAPVVYDYDGMRPESIAITDINGDGKPDIMEADYFGAVGVLLGNGDGTFQSLVSYASGGSAAYSVAVADVNGDGRPDLMLATIGAASVLINTSIFPTTTALVSSPNPSDYSRAVIFTATITPLYEFGKTMPTGLVKFFDGTTNLGSSSLNSAGIASLSTSTLTIGTHNITASYAGDPNFGSSTSQVLSQVVQGAIVQLSPPSVNFGNVTVGGNGVKQGILVNLTNTGNVALTISAIAITGADSADFIQNNLCPSSLAPGFNCTISVQFVPTTTGTRTGAVTITDNAANSPQSVALTGVGVLPAVSLAPASLSFATQVVFTNSKTQTVTLNNTGLGYLFITNIGISGPFTQTNSCGSTVNPGSSCTFTVTFKPTKAGAVTGSLSITDNAPLSPQTVSLKGTGTDVQFNPVSFNFGNQPVGTKSLPKKITLSNKGSVAVSISKISLTGTNAADFPQTNTCGTSVAAGASCFITVTFTPSAAGKRTANVSVIDNGGGSPQTVSLTGTGT
jgi:hypothetical protein